MHGFVYGWLKQATRHGSLTSSFSTRTEYIKNWKTFLMDLIISDVYYFDKHIPSSLRSRLQSALCTRANMTGNPFVLIEIIVLQHDHTCLYAWPEQHTVYIDYGNANLWLIRAPSMNIPLVVDGNCFKVLMKCSRSCSKCMRSLVSCSVLL